ncbi:MAG: hypothetical protein WBN96_09515 [Gammaproteobacteria bacterium]
MNQAIFDQGREALKTSDFKAAERDFQDVMTAIDEQHEQYNRVASFLGLSQVLNDNRNGLILCRDAASSEVLDGQVFLNLAAAEWHSKNRKRAIEALVRGTKIDGDHVQLKRAMQLADSRKRPVFSFLPRAHPLNRMVGRLMRSSSSALSVQTLLY